MPTLTDFVLGALEHRRRDDFAALHPALQRRLVLSGSLSQLEYRGEHDCIVLIALTLDLIAWAQNAECAEIVAI